MSLIEYHRNLVADEGRNAAFAAALKRVLRRGHQTVADIGGGTGLLAFLARQLGATQVHVYEYAPTMELAQELARRNGIDGLYFHHQHSTKVKRPTRVDIVVSETLGNYAYEENIIETLGDAVQRILKPGGVVIPQRIRQYVAPVTSARFYNELTVWDRLGFDLDLSAARDLSLNNLYVRTFRREDLFNVEQAPVWDEVDLRQANASVRQGAASWSFERGHTVYGFAVWWRCELVRGIELSTDPIGPKTHWEQLYFPVLSPLKVGAGDTLHLRIKSDSRLQVGVNVSWEAELSGAAGKRKALQRLDMKRGSL